jgi:tetratricopeptide (TPR) repeat protein
MADRLGLVEPRVEASKTLAITRDDALEAIEILQDAAALSEAHGLLRASSMAHNNIGYFSLLSLFETEQCLQHFIKAAEIRRQIGDIDHLIMYLLNALMVWVSLGQLRSGEEYVAEFLHKSSATETQAKECLQFTHAYVLHHRGEWMQVLADTRNQLKKLREGGNTQYIVERNRLLVSAILELHRFAGLDYLAEAEAALLENIGLKWAVNESYFMLVVISARKIHIQGAQEYLAEAPEKCIYKQEESYRLKAEVELAMVDVRWDEAVSTCLSLIDIYQAGGYRWEWARTLIDLGDALIGRDLPGDRERAHEVFRQSLEVFTEMDAPGYIRVLEERLGRL